MSFDYPNLAATAQRLLEQFGMDTTLTRTVPGGYDPETGTTTGPTVTTWTGTGARFDYTQRDIDGTLIRVGDRRVLIGVDGMTLPLTGDVVTLGVRSFTVVQASEIAPAGVAVLFDVQVRA